MFRNCLLFLIALLLMSCHTPGVYVGPAEINTPIVVNGQKIYPELINIAPGFKIANSPFAEYKAGAQDILTVIVWNHPELTIPSMQTTSETVNFYSYTNESANNPPGILISKNGEIFFPLAGKMQVAGLTVEQIRLAITKRLYKFIRNPQVSVRVTIFRSKLVYVMGEVMKAGIQPITDRPLSIMDAINLAGGIDRDTSDAHYIYIIRGNYLHPKVFWLDATTPGAMLLANFFQLQPRDIVIVSAAGVTRYSRVINKLLPTVQTFMNPVIKND